MKAPHVGALSLKDGLSLKRHQASAFGIATPPPTRHDCGSPLDSEQRNPASTDVEHGHQVRVYARAGSVQRQRTLIGALARLK